MKKIVTYVFLVFNVFAFSDSFNDNEDERTILKQEQRSEQERLQKEFKKREEIFNQLKSEKTDKQEVSTNEIKFYISQINLEDNERLLNEIEKENILGKYIDKDLGSTDITNLITDLTNRLIAKGYITSVATISENNDLSTKTLNLKIVPGKIEKIILNEDKTLDNLKKYFLVDTKAGKVLNILSFSDTFNDNEDERTILKQEQRSEQERLQKEFQKREEIFNQLKSEKTNKQEVSIDEIKFQISQINLEDNERLLNEIEKRKYTREVYR